MPPASPRRVLPALSGMDYFHPGTQKVVYQFIADVADRFGLSPEDPTGIFTDSYGTWRYGKTHCYISGYNNIYVNSPRRGNKFTIYRPGYGVTIEYEWALDAVGEEARDRR